MVGYIIKHATFLKWIPNDDIPVILAFVGAVMNIAVSGLGVESVVFGAIMGLCANSIDKMKDTRNRLQEYLIEK